MPTKKRNQLIEYTQNDLVLLHQVNPENTKMKAYCGLSICKAKSEKYDALKFYKLLGDFRKIEPEN